MQILYNEPAIFHKGALLIGDTHFGIEAKLRKKGIFYYDFSSKIATRLERLLKKTEAKKLIILGDAKEEIGAAGTKTKDIFDRLRSLVEVIVVKGNHDGMIEKLGIKIKPAKGFVFEGLGLLHGHAWPSEKVMKQKIIVMAHQHPQLEIIKAGKRIAEPVWLVGKIDAASAKKFYMRFNRKAKMVIIPAFNPLVGSPINLGKRRQLGPLINKNIFKLNDTIVYSLQGISFGKLSEL